MRPTHRVAATYFLALNTFLLFVALPILIFYEEGHAATEEKPTRARIFVAPIGGVRGPSDQSLNPGPVLRSALVDEIHAGRYGEAISVRGADSVLPTSPYEPSLERVLEAAEQLGATHVLQVRIDDHLVLDGGVRAVALSSGLWTVTEGGRLVWRGRSVRAFPTGGDARAAAQVEASKILALALRSPRKTRRDLEPGVSPLTGTTLAAVPSPTPTYYPEVNYTGSARPQDSLSRDQQARHQGISGPGRTDGDPSRRHPVRNGTAMPPASTPPTPPPATLPPSTAALSTAGQGEPLHRIPAVTAAATPAPPVSRPRAPVVAAASAPAPRVEIDIPDDRELLGTFYFPTNSAVLDGRNQEGARALATHLRENPSDPILVEGHADQRGSREENYGLSRRRADSVREALLGAGAGNPDRIFSYGLSEDRPVAGGSDQDALARNRRVEVFRVGGSGGIVDSGWQSETGTPLPSIAQATGRPAQGSDREAAERVRGLLAKYRGEQPTPPSVPGMPPSAATNECDETNRRDNLIRAGDSLKVLVQGRGELTRTVDIDQDGRFNFPLIGSIRAAGKNLGQFTDHLKGSLEEYIKAPQVQVSRVYSIKVFGHVNRQGLFQFDAPPSMLSLLARTEGISRDAVREPVGGVSYGQFIARIHGACGVQVVDLQRYMKTGEGLDDVRLGQGDTVIIEYNRFKPITVIGTNTTSVLYRPGLTLVEALTMSKAMDTEKQQNWKNIRVFRNVGDGKMQRLEVNLHDILHRGQVNRDIQLEPGDYVVVPRRSQRITVPILFKEILGAVSGYGILKRIY